MKLSAAQRAALPKEVFALPSKAPGAGSYPMPDPQHAAAAKAMASRFASEPVQKKVDAKANKVLKRKQRGKVRKGS